LEYPSEGVVTFFEGQVKQPLNQSEFYMSLTSGKKKNVLLIYSAEQPESDATPLAKALLPHASGRYGFALAWSGPGSFWAYAFGILEFSDAKVRREEFGEPGAWGILFRDGARLITKGLFRDVYPINIITNKHLSHAVDNVLLRDLIGSNSGYGTIGGSTGECHLWLVPRTDLQRIRSALDRAGLLYTSTAPQRDRFNA
jgi:hypothetical protein